jgi:hypothetical protein
MQAVRPNRAEDDHRAKRLPWVPVLLAASGVVLVLAAGALAWVPSGTVEVYPGKYRLLLSRYKDRVGTPATRSLLCPNGFRLVLELPGGRFPTGCLHLEWEKWKD